LAQERTRKRHELLAATERQFDVVARAVARDKRPLRGAAKIGLRLGKVMGRFKMAKHFKLTITDDSFRYERDEKAIAAEAALDGIYVVRTTVSAERMSSDEIVRSYKSLANVERAFRCIKTTELNIRPIHHRKEERVRAHVLLCMLAYYVEWHMRRLLAPILFDDDDRKGGEARRASVVAPARRSERAEDKALTKRTDADEPVHSFKSLFRDLATIAKNRIHPKATDAPVFEIITKPTSFQQRALDLLGVQLLP